MATRSRDRLEFRGWPGSRIGRRAIALGGLSGTGIALSVRGFALDMVNPADS